MTGDPAVINAERGALQAALAMAPWRRLEARLLAFERPHTPGCMVTVLQGGEPVHLRGYGRANIEFDVPWTPATRYRIASLTKQFIGVAFLLLEEAGKLCLSDDVRTYLPEMPLLPTTLEQLLRMTSGIRHEEVSLVSLVGETGPVSLEHMYRLVTRSPRNFRPGEHALYSCANYRLLARVLERVTGKGLDAHLREAVFAPLGMDATLSAPDYSYVVPGLAYLYHPQGDGYRREATGLQMSGDGALISTTADLIAWARNLSHNALGSPGLITRLATPTVLASGKTVGYGLGLGVGRYRGLRVWEHGGSFGTYLFHLPGVGFTVLLLCNRLDLDRWALAREMADALLFEDGGDERSAARWLGYEGEGLPSLLHGSYVEPESGYRLDLGSYRGALEAHFLGKRELLYPTGPGRFASSALASALTLTFEGSPEASVLLAEVGRKAPLRFVPLTEGASAPLATPPSDYVGCYYNRELEGFQRVFLDGSSLVLQLGSGRSKAALHPLTPTAPDCFEAGGLVLKFVRDAARRVMGVHESVNLARDVWFGRLPGPEGSP